MVNISNLKTGDRVKIVDHWPDGGRQNPNGKMDHWLGCIMTVRQIDYYGVSMEEDAGELYGSGWCWDGTMLEYIVDEETSRVNVEDLI